MRSNWGRDKLLCVGGPLDGELVMIATGCREPLAPGGCAYASASRGVGDGGGGAM